MKKLLFLTIIMSFAQINAEDIKLLIENKPKEAVRELVKAIDDKDYARVTDFVKTVKSPEDIGYDSASMNVKEVRAVIIEKFKKAIEEKNYSLITAIVKGAINGTLGRVRPSPPGDAIRPVFIKAIGDNDYSLVEAFAKAGKSRLLQRGFIKAIETGNKEMLELFFKNGFNINDKLSLNGMAPLMIALSVGAKVNKDIVKMFLDKGADLKIMGDRNTPILMYAAHANKDIFDMLIAKGADVHAKTADGSTILMAAVYGNDKDIVKLLLDKGLDVNAKDKNGKTVLMRAVNGKNKEIVQMLLDKGAKVNDKDNAGLSALMHAIGIYSLDRYNGIALQLQDVDKEIVKILLNKGADVLNIRDKDGITPLIVAISDNLDNEIIRMIFNAMVKSPADIPRRRVVINAQDRFGKTALKYAQEKDKKEIVEMLKKAGAK